VRIFVAIHLYARYDMDGFDCALLQGPDARVSKLAVQTRYRNKLLCRGKCVCHRCHILALD
jgi:hypothetical protein